MKPPQKVLEREKVRCSRRKRNQVLKVGEELGPGTFWALISDIDRVFVVPSQLGELKNGEGIIFQFSRNRAQK